MRILVLSDLHGNATALNAALAAAQGRWEQIVCLGDVVGYGPDPNEVTSKIRELGAQTIRGNHDKAATGLMPTDDSIHCESGGRLDPLATISRQSQMAYGVAAWSAGGRRNCSGARCAAG